MLTFSSTDSKSTIVLSDKPVTPQTNETPCNPSSNPMTGYRTLGKYKISNMCMQSYPCKHWIEYEDGKHGMMNGDEIYSMLRKEGVYDAHFNAYRNRYIFGLCFTTDSVIDPQNNEKPDLNTLVKRAEEDKIRKQAELDANPHKASSRLDKLKQLHCAH